MMVGITGLHELYLHTLKLGGRLAIQRRMTRCRPLRSDLLPLAYIFFIAATFNSQTTQRLHVTVY